MQRLHLLIEQEVTGTPKELAQRLHISERSLYGLIERLKEYEANIAYSRSRRTYYYCDDFQFKVNISVLIGGNELCQQVYKMHYQ